MAGLRVMLFCLWRKKMDQNFCYCRHCGNIVVKVNDSGVPVMCCGEAMGVLLPNTSDGAKEKHVPTHSVKCGKVTVRIGEIAHPMTPEHHIAWVKLQTNKGNQFKRLTPGTEPVATFCVDEDEKIEAVFAYCNLHSLFKS